MCSTATISRGFPEAGKHGIPTPRADVWRICSSKRPRGMSDTSGKNEKTGCATARGATPVLSAPHLHILRA